MVTRLQSAKGSFVQSPKGAFDSVSPVAAFRLVGKGGQLDQVIGAPQSAPCLAVSFNGDGGSGSIFEFTLEAVDGGGTRNITAQEFIDEYQGTSWSADSAPATILDIGGAGTVFCSDANTTAWDPGVAHDREQFWVDIGSPVFNSIYQEAELSQSIFYPSGNYTKVP